MCIAFYSPRFIRLSVSCLVACDCLFASSGVTAQSDFWTVESIEEKSIAHRESISSGELHVVSNMKIYKEGSLQRHRKISRTIFIDGKSMRVDSSNSYLVSPDEDMKAMEYTKSTTFVDDIFMTTTTRAPKGGGTLVTKIDEIDSLNSDQYATSDPRLIGMYPNSFANLKSYKFNSRLGNRRGLIQDVALEIEKLGDYELAKLSYVADWGQDSVWISPDQDFSVVKIERTGSDRRIIESSLAFVDGFGWFPESCRYERRRNGELVKEEDLKIRVQQFNEPVDSDTFTLKSMGISEGEKVLNYTVNPSRFMVMGKEGLEEIRNQLDPKVDAGGNSSGMRRFFLVINGVLFAALAGMIMFRYWGRLAGKA